MAYFTLVHIQPFGELPTLEILKFPSPQTCPLLARWTRRIHASLDPRRYTAESESTDECSSARPVCLSHTHSLSQRSTQAFLLPAKNTQTLQKVNNVLKLKK